MPDEGRPGREAAYLDNCRKLIAVHGWMVQYVAPRVGRTGFVFAYTAGLCVAGLPELVIAGLPPQPSAIYLNALARRVLVEDPAVGTQWTVEEQPSLVWRFAPVAARWARENVTLPRRLFPDATVTALQALWPDKHGVYPDEPGWAAMSDVQPCLSLQNN